MTDLEKTIYCLENNPVYDEYGITKFTKEAVKSIVEILKEQQQKKSKEEVLTAIISSQGYTDVETFKRTVLEIDNFEDYFLGGLFRAVQTIEKLFDG